MVDALREAACASPSSVEADVRGRARTHREPGPRSSLAPLGIVGHARTTIVAAQPDIHIDDLAQPHLPWPLRAANIVAPHLARWRYSFDLERMLTLARKATRLEDFGDPSFHEPFELLLRALEQEADLTAVGRLAAGRTMTDLLRNRLRLEALIAEHPEIVDEPIVAPLVIVGLPRSGTTHLFTLLSLHPALRSLPLWESLEPVPSAAQRAEKRIRGWCVADGCPAFTTWLSRSCARSTKSRRRCRTRRFS
jgi:hypothetical protein